ncbi:hypothetical protein KOI35_14750 [Actinoplanes bogorensis]|uniref:DUF4156 domain-containing protein n=1 Tax=Paractinoplanes bogorensis TaxID=1610840 RepID=A0ABS5YPW5_9ACTN|nr:hypothetical protein [Actinoplanes bogorensis]MBU2664758.1 hypothetical protein [Actinoplanes bogorensis]
MKIRVALVALLATVSLTGCASLFDDIPDANDDVPTTAPVAQCGDDAQKAVAKEMTSDAVEVVKVIGSCTQVQISTSLGPDDKDAAREICETAAKVAYVGDIKVVSVEDADGHELSTGFNGTPCI